MSPHNIKQATLIPSAQSLPNPRGTAPGWWIDKGKKIIIAMPGPPGEMQYMWEKEVMPRLQQRYRKEFILSRTLKSFGLSEAGIDEAVSPLLPLDNTELGIYAKPDGIQIRLIARALERYEAERLLAQGEASLRKILDEYIWGLDDDSLESIVGRLLVERALTLATMESFTGGILAHNLIGISCGSSYKGGFVACTQETKIAMGVDEQIIDSFGEVSYEVAEAMAGAARQRLEADIGIGITGGTGEGNPSGLAYIAIWDGEGKWTRDWKFPPRHPEYKRYAASAALFGLRERLLALDR
jgi:nicotinamide-nucleotide amidase